MSYEQPDKGEKFSPRDNPDWKDKLFLVYPTEVNTVNFVSDKTGLPEPSDIVTADVAIIDLIDPQTGRPKVLKGARIGGKALVPQIKPKIERKAAALGRLRQLPAQGAKSGAFVLDEFTPADAALAEQFENGNPWRNGFEQPVSGPPTGAASPAPATAPPVAGVTPGLPWFASAEGAALLGKLVSNGVANATTFDLATAQMVGASFA